jgi:hypothetical protein
MRSGLIALRAAGVAAALVLAPAATGAYAHDAGKMKVTVVPAAPAPGDDIEVRVSGCEGTTGAATSEEFVTDAELSGRDGADDQLFGDTTVKSTVSAGTYDISVTCDGHDHREVGKNRVVDQPPKQSPSSPSSLPNESGELSEADPPSPPSEADQSSQPQLPDEPGTADEPGRPNPPTPVAPVRAGGGGSAALAAANPAHHAGPGTPHTVIGLVLAGVAAVAVALRSVRRRRTDAD